MTEQTQSDEELAAAAKRGDRAAYDQLVRRLLRPAMALGWQYTHSVEDAEEIVQDGFHRMVRALDGYDETRAFRPWFYAIVRNVARSAVGKDRRRAALAPITALEHDPPGLVPDERESGDAIQALEDLPPMQQACVRLCDLEGFTSVEAGQMLGIAEGTVRAHLHRGRGRLRSVLEQTRGIVR